MPETSPTTYCTCDPNRCEGGPTASCRWKVMGYTSLPFPSGLVAMKLMDFLEERFPEIKASSDESKAFILAEMARIVSASVPKKG